MFDVAPSELLLIVIVAIIVIGPKDLPVALRTAGRWMARIRKVSGHFRSGLDAMIREAELEELEKKWAEQNAQIMREHPQGVDEPERTGAWPSPQMEPLAGPPTAAAAEAPAPATPPAPAAESAAQPKVQD